VGGEDNGGLIAFDLATGDEKWRWAGEGPQYASPALLTLGEDTKVLVTLSSKSFLGVAVADGRLLWQIPFVPEGRAYNASTPIVSGDTVIISGAGRGTFAYRLAAEGANVTPTPLWTSDLAVQYNTPVLKDGLLYGLSSEGKLFCLQADTGATVWVDDNLRSRGFGQVVDAGTALLVLPDNGELIAYQPTAAGFAPLATYKVAEGGTYASPVLSDSRIITKDQSAVTVWGW